MTAIRIEEIKPSIGGIVHIAKADLLNDDVAGAVRSALDARDVLVFPRLGLTDEDSLPSPTVWAHG